MTISFREFMMETQNVSESLMDKEGASAIRDALKKAFPKCKFAVQKQRGMAVDVYLLKGNIDFYSKGIYTENGGLKNKERNERFRQDKYYRVSVNVRNWTANETPHHKFFNKVEEIITTSPFKADKGFHAGNKYRSFSDPMTDYFDHSFYWEFSIGDYNKPYIYQK